MSKISERKCGFLIIFGVHEYIKAKYTNNREEEYSFARTSG